MISHGGGSLIDRKSGGSGGSSPTPQVTEIDFGDPNTDGTWRIVINGTNLSFQLREAGTYNEKMAATP